MDGGGTLVRRSALALALQPSPSTLSCLLPRLLHPSLILARYELQQMWLALKICQSHKTESKGRDKKQGVWRNFLEYLNYDPFNFLDLSALST